MRNAVTVLLLLTLCCAGAFATGTQEIQGETRPTVSVAILDRGKVPPEKGTYEQNDVTEWINEHAPVAVEFVPIPRWETRQKYNLLLASQSAPDVMMEYSFNLVQDFVNQGVLMEVSEVVDEHGPNIRSLTPPETAKYARFNDGEYCIPSIRPIQANWNLMVRKDWLDGLGLDIPTTTEELYAAMAAISEAGLGWGYDLTGRGAQGIGLIANLYGVMNNWWTEVDGELEMGYVTEQYRDAIAFCARLYDEGIVDPEYFTDQGGVRAEQQFVNGELGFFATNRISELYPILKSNDPEAEVVPVPAPKGPYGQHGYYQETAAGYLNMIPADSENAAAAVQYLDWMITDGWEWVIYGEEGKHYEMIDGVHVSIAGEEVMARDLVYRRDYATLDQDWRTPEDLLVMYAGDGADPLVRAAYEIYVESIHEAQRFPFARPLPTNGLDVPLYTQLSPDLNKFGAETWTKAIIGDLTIDEAFQLVKDEFDNLGYQDLKERINASARRFGYL